MRCPFCARDNTRVIDSRDTSDGAAVRRRRACPLCKRRFTTYEKPEQPTLFVIKKDGRREPFDRTKMRRGVETACAKRPLPVSAIDELIARVEAHIFRTYEREVSAAAIGELVMRELRDLDHVAYVRFASVYRDFQDVSEFVEEVRPMLQ